MKFRLTYDGRLLGSSNANPHAEHKHQIRMRFHQQLKLLWERHPELKSLRDRRFPDVDTAVSGLNGGPFPGGEAYSQLVASKHSAHGHRWLPLVLGNHALKCSVEVLFLRLGAAGNVFNVGDIDGRLKTIFDALAIPRSGSSIAPPEDQNEPTYVLLADDSQISHVTMEADELLEPVSQIHINEAARIVITVNIRMIQANWMSLRFAGD